MPEPPRNPALARLDALAGRWRLQASFAGDLAGPVWCTFEWLEDGAFLRQHTAIDPAAPPLPPELAAISPLPATAIIGLDGDADRFSMLYADRRGVLRVYAMTLDAGVWRVWREAPGFHQRFAAAFDDDGGAIRGAWEMSRDDGATWQHDFDLTDLREAA